MLQSTVERLYCSTMYCDIPRGVFIVRGENVLLLGEIVRPLYRPTSSPRIHANSQLQDLDQEDDVHLRAASVEEVFTQQKRELAETQRRDKVHRRKLRALGFEDEGEVLH